MRVEHDIYAMDDTQISYVVMSTENILSLHVYMYVHVHVIL